VKRRSFKSGIEDFGANIPILNTKRRSRTAAHDARIYQIEFLIFLIVRSLQDTLVPGEFAFKFAELPPQGIKLTELLQEGLTGRSVEKLDTGMHTDHSSCW
jgi:hypothetical protein